MKLLSPAYLGAEYLAEGMELYLLHSALQMRIR